MILVSGCSLAIDVHFEEPTSGFFLEQEAEPAPSVPTVLGAATTQSPRGELGHTRRFTVLQTGQMVGLRGSYGPFLSRQTVPLALALPDLTNSSLEPGLKPHLMDLSAHLVTREVRKDSPVLRVLFHTGQRAFTSKKKPAVCILLTATLGNRSVAGACSPGGREGTCLGQLTVPAGQDCSYLHSPFASLVPPHLALTNAPNYVFHKNLPILLCNCTVLIVCLKPFYTLL